MSTDAAVPQPVPVQVAGQLSATQGNASPPHEGTIELTGKPVEAGDVNVKGESGGDDREKSKPNLKATLDIKANMRKKAGVRSPWLRVLKGD